MHQLGRHTSTVHVVATLRKTAIVPQLDFVDVDMKTAFKNYVMVSDDFAYDSTLFNRTTLFSIKKRYRKNDTDLEYQSQSFFSSNRAVLVTRNEKVKSIMGRKRTVLSVNDLNVALALTLTLFAIRPYFAKDSYQSIALFLKRKRERKVCTLVSTLAYLLYRDTLRFFCFTGQFYA